MRYNSILSTFYHLATFKLVFLFFTLKGKQETTKVATPSTISLIFLSYKGYVYGRF